MCVSDGECLSNLERHALDRTPRPPQKNKKTLVYFIYRSWPPGAQRGAVGRAGIPCAATGLQRSCPEFNFLFFSHEIKTSSFTKKLSQY